MTYDHERMSTDEDDPPRWTHRDSSDQEEIRSVQRFKQRPQWELPYGFQRFFECRNRLQTRMSGGGGRRQGLGRTATRNVPFFASIGMEIFSPSRGKGR